MRYKIKDIIAVIPVGYTAYKRSIKYSIYQWSISHNLINDYLDFGFSKFENIFLNLLVFHKSKRIIEHDYFMCVRRQRWSLAWCVERESASRWLVCAVERIPVLDSADYRLYSRSLQHPIAGANGNAGVPVMQTVGVNSSNLVVTRATVCSLHTDSIAGGICR